MFLRRMKEKEMLMMQKLNSPVTSSSLKGSLPMMN